MTAKFYPVRPANKLLSNHNKPKLHRTIVQYEKKQNDAVFEEYMDSADNGRNILVRI
jgi:hypothetical protein